MKNTRCSPVMRCTGGHSLHPRLTNPELAKREQRRRLCGYATAFLRARGEDRVPVWDSKWSSSASLTQAQLGPNIIRTAEMEYLDARAAGLSLAMQWGVSNRPCLRILLFVHLRSPLTYVIKEKARFWFINHSGNVSVIARFYSRLPVHLTVRPSIRK